MWNEQSPPPDGSPPSRNSSTPNICRSASTNTSLRRTSDAVLVDGMPTPAPSLSRPSIARDLVHFESPCKIHSRRKRSETPPQAQTPTRLSLSNFIGTLMGSENCDSDTSSSNSDHSHITDNQVERSHTSDIWRGTGISRRKECKKDNTIASRYIEDGPVVEMPNTTTLEGEQLSGSTNFVTRGAFNISKPDLNPSPAISSWSEPEVGTSVHTSFTKSKTECRWTDFADCSTFNFLNASRSDHTASDLPIWPNASPGGLDQYIRGLDSTSFALDETSSAALFAILGFSSKNSAVSKMTSKGSGYFSQNHVELMSGTSTGQPSREWRTIQPARIHDTKTLFSALPDEIVQSIYMYLHPKDFNAARYTCRTWMNASLERGLLALMLRRGAWSISAERMLEERLQHFYRQAGQYADNAVWLLSCIFSRECVLAANWAGNGLSDLRHDAIPVCEHNRDEQRTPSCSTPRHAFRPIFSFRRTTIINFEELLAENTPKVRSHGLIFTASICGKYVLVAQGSMVYVYELFGDALRAMTSVQCPRRVLAMSMDLSSRRFSVAMLLEGRLGMMCDLKHGTHTFSSHSGISPSVVVESSTGHKQSYLSTTSRKRLYPENDRLTVSDTVIAANRDAACNEPDDDLGILQVQSARHIETVEDDSTEYGRENAAINRTWNVHIPSSGQGDRYKGKEKEQDNVPIETGPRSLYRQLCSDDDPPRSVAICPQRKCVAFGCSVGLELHWVDAVTDQDLNRWFPLTGPSDYLYFLPARRGVDSPRKLRLISSAAHPSLKPAITRHFSTSRSHPSTTNHSWTSSEYNVADANFAGHIKDCDHFRAVPLSDGFHILFTDPESGMLSLGSDAPIGDSRRLLRKIMLIPPHEGALPRLYTAAADTIHGPRVVVAYKDEVYLYSIPSDVFELSRREQEPGSLSGELRQEASVWLDWWPSEEKPTSPRDADRKHECKSPSGPREIWPVNIKGVNVGTLRNLVEVTLNHHNGRMSVWGFAHDGEATVWQISTCRRDSFITRRNISRGGQVMAAFTIDADGDVVMSDAEDHSPDSSLDRSMRSSRAQRASDIVVACRHSSGDEERGDLQDEVAWSTIFQVQHDHDDEVWEGPEFHDCGEMDLMRTNIPVEILTSRTDEVDVYRE